MNRAGRLAALLAAYLFLPLSAEAVPKERQIMRPAVERSFGEFPERLENKYLALQDSDTEGSYIALKLSGYGKGVFGITAYRGRIMQDKIKDVDAAIARGDHEVAYHILVTDWAFRPGHRFADDVEMDGITSEGYPLEGGSVLKDHSHGFNSNEEATAWLTDTLEYVGKALGKGSSD